MKLSPFLLRRLHWLNLPTLSLLALLQRTPVLRVAAHAGQQLMSSPFGAVLKSSVAAVASLGAVHSLAGATQLSSSSASPFAATAGNALTIGFAVTGTLSEPETWTVGGTVPPGLAFAGGQTTGTLSGATLTLSGTPTTAGSYTITFRAHDEAGFNSPLFDYTINVTGSAATAPTVTTPPQSQSAAAGGNVTLTVAASGSPAPTVQWRLNGTTVAGATATSLALNNLQPANTGLYVAVLTNSAGSATSDSAIVGVTTAEKVIGTGEIVGTDVPHPNGNIFDQVLVNGAAEAITADFAANQVTRTSYIDLDNDIVQVEFSGPGTLSLVLDNAGGQAPPVNYNQPSVNYVRGHAGIVITGADERTNVSVFTVGRATAFDPTGAYNILLAPSATNVPANNGSSLFVGHGATAYDGIADIAFIAISTTNGKFGGIRTSNATYFAAKGLTGIYAPGVAFQGPIFVGDIIASEAATPVLIVGSVSDSRVTGGDMKQDNNAAVQVSGITQLKFTAGGDSHGNSLLAQANQGVFMQGGTNVTSQIVVNP